MRATYLDSLRGLAVVWMIVFHFSYDMMLLGFVNWNFGDGFWWYFPRVIAFTFLFCVGAALNFVHSPRINWHSLGHRSLKIGAGALAVSLGTYFFLPGLWIYFGTLHCILVGSILGAFFVNHRRWAGAVMLVIMTGQYALGYDIKWVSSITQKPSLDFIPIYPWFWAILLGLLAGPPMSKIAVLQNLKSIPLLDFLGKHSLKIYLIHQPLIYGLLLAVQALVSR